MSHQREPLAEFISCPVCCKLFNHSNQRPMSLSCGHTVCKSCLLGRLGNERCPFDQEPFPKDAEKLPSNYALMQLVEATNTKERTDDDNTLQGPEHDPKCFEIARQCIQEISVYLKPLAENSSDDEGSPSSPGVDKSQTKCFLSRPLQRKVISLIQCQILEEEGRSRAARISRAIGERILSEVLTARQYPHQLSANLWAAVRARGCQFLGPAMQEEVLKLILLTLENGCMLSRKVLVLYVVGKLSSTYPHVSKTAIGHVVQLLYRASCFKVAKREEESSLMQLKEEFREYEALRREHDAQIVQIAMEAGLRIPPEQWSSLLYGDMAHKSHMQSIMDKLQNPQSFSQCVLELVQMLQRNGDPGGFLKLRHRFEFLSCIDPNPDAQVPSLQDMKAIMQSLSMVMKSFVSFMAQPSVSRRSTAHPDTQAVPNAQYKTSMCWDVTTKGYCPRGNTCTFAHTQQELERHRQRSRRNSHKLGPKLEGTNGVGVGRTQETGVDEMEACFGNFSMDENSNGHALDNLSASSHSISSSSGSESKRHYSGPLTNECDPAYSGQETHTDSAVNPPRSHIPPPIHSVVHNNVPAYSQLSKEAPAMTFHSQPRPQTSFHPHNMRGPPPAIRPQTSHCQPFTPFSGSQHNLRPHTHHSYHQGQQLQNGLPQPTQPQHPTRPRHHFTPAATTSVMHDYGQLHNRGSTHNNNINADGLPQSSSAPGITMNSSFNSYNEKSNVGAVEQQSIDGRQHIQHQHFQHTSDGEISRQPHHQQHQLAMRMATHSFGGPDGALQSLTNSNHRVLQQHHHPSQLLPTAPQTPVIPAVLVDASAQDPISLPHPPPLNGFTDLHLTHPTHQFHTLPPPLPHPPASVMTQPPPVHFMPTPTPSLPHVPHIQVPPPNAVNLVMWAPEHSGIDAVIVGEKPMVSMVPAEMLNIPDTAIVGPSESMMVIPAALGGTSTMPVQTIVVEPKQEDLTKLHVEAPEWNTESDEVEQEEARQQENSSSLAKASEKENTLEDLKMLKQEIIDLLQEEPTFLKSRPQVYCADSLEGGFDGLKTVLGNNQRKKEAMPKLVSDMFVATRSTTSLDMLPYPPECPMPGSEMKPQPGLPVSPQTDYPSDSYFPPLHINDRGYPPPTSVMAIPTGAVSSASGNALYNSLGSSFEIASSLSFIDDRHTDTDPDAEFSCFPNDDDEEILIPFEHTVVSKFGPISRMARAKTNNCAPVQVTADSSKKMTPALAATPIERPMPIAIPVSSRFGSLVEQIPEPPVKPTPTIAPSVWQESPQPSQMNIAMLRTGAAEAVSNNERLAYELQAVELEISLKTGKSPEPVRKMIHEAVSNPTTTMAIPGGDGCDGAMASSLSSEMAMMLTSTSTSSTSSSFSSLSRVNRVNMGHGHVTEFLARVKPGSNSVPSELAARDMLEEYQRSRMGLSKFSH